MAISTRTNVRKMPIVHYRQTVTAKWIIGHDAFTSQEYLLHTQYPAFFAKIGHSEADAILAPLSYGTADDRSFYDFVWFDPYPGESQFLALMREAGDAFRAYRFQ